MTSPFAEQSEPADASDRAPASRESVEEASGAVEPSPVEGPLEEALPPYDAALLLSFGGPEAPEEVLPFLRRVTAGRDIPDARLEEVGEHYYAFGGRSPINDQNRALLAALRAELRRRGIATPITWGNRNSDPFLVDALRDTYDAGHRRVMVVTTSAYSSYSSCRQYRENLADAVRELREEGRDLQVDKVRQYATHPSFGRVNTRLVTDAVRELGEPDDTKVRVAFVTHSIPVSMDDTSGPGDGEGNLYWHQHDELAHVILDEASATLDRSVEGALVYCSRSGPPSQPWLEPDINDYLRQVHEQGVTHVVIAPIGFISDHMEVVYDLDTEAAETAQELGLTMVRTPTVGIDPEFVSGLVDLMQERAAEARGEVVSRAAWPGEAMPSVCAPGCCPNLREARPALCGKD